MGNLAGDEKVEVNNLSDKFVIIDGNSLAHRAFYALPLLSNAQGFITNAIYGFYKMLAKVIADEKPTYLAVAFDKGKIVFRHQHYADYKGTRKGTPEELKPQFPVLKDLLKAMNIALWEIEGYEADDLIGTLAKLGEKAGLLNLIVTGDRDALQLIAPHTKVLLTRKGISEIEIYDEQVLAEKYGLKPAQMIDVKGLMGDQSDNIPGIPGVGEKTALKLIREYGNLENVLVHQADFQGKKLGEALANYGEQALLSKKLATIVTNVPLPLDLKQCQKEEPDYPRFLALLKELEFKSIWQEVLQERGDFEEERTGGNGSASVSSSLTLSSKKALADYLARCQADLVLYLETEKKGPRDLRITALGLKIPDQEAALCSWQKEEELSAYLQVLKPFLENERIKKTVYDTKAVMLALDFYQIKLQGVVKDILLMAYLLNPSRPKQDLPSLVQEELACAVPAEGEAVVPFYLNALEKLGESLFAELAEQEMLGLYQDLELPLAAVLAEMEKTGVKLNQVILATIGKELDRWIARLTEEIYHLAGEEFNINSPKQLGVILFEKLGLPTGKKTKTGYSTNAEVLEDLALEHEIAAKILFYRQMVKLKSTYIDGLSVLIEPFTSKVYTSFNQAVTATGRLSSTEPNLQNIPIRMEEGRRIRKAFLPSPGKLLLSADYSQIELRVLAHISGDEVMIEAFNKDQDIHLRTAAEVFGVPLDAVSQEMRQAAKAVNFGIVYGISDFGLSRDLGIARAEAKQYIDSYFARYGGVRDYLRRIIAEAKKKGYVTTLLKRRRYLPDLQSRNYHLRSFAERAAMNTPIQGSAADIIKLAMLKLYRVLQESEWEGIKLIL
ncbi:MAG: DNA polymerase I, partial [Clostridia bacterium]|nr:DNA polymerase I [Clostridia bacterium]